jgi:transposase
MDKRIKYSFKKKLSLVLAIRAGKISMRAGARKIGGDPKTVRRWIGLYQHYGSAGLKFRHGTYTSKFKIQVVRHMLKNHLSLIQTAAFFGVPNEQTVARWLNKHEREGIAGLLKNTDGRKKSLMPKKPKSNNKISSASPEAQLAALQAENEYLRAENAFLKKLDALIQEEKAAKKQSKQQKLSKN